MTQMSVATETPVERPTQVPPTSAKPSWKVAVKRAIAKFSEDQCTDVAAMLTYYSMLALFPGLVAVVSLIGVFNVKTDDLIEVIAGVMDKPVNDADFDTIRDIIDRFSSSGGAWIALIVGVLAALWSASGYVGGFSRALNRIYGIGEGRSIFSLRPWLYLITAIEVILIVVVLLALVLSGSIASEIGDKIGVGKQAVEVWDIAKWPFVALVVVLIICLLYWATPNVRKPRKMFLSWGALVGFVVWVLGSAAFAVYITMTGGSSYNKTYGAFAGAVMFLLWLWITNLALLFGAELDAELERTRQLKSGLPAEEMILLPARDRNGLIKKAKKYDETVRDAHDLRVGSGAETRTASETAVAPVVRRPVVQPEEKPQGFDLERDRTLVQQARLDRRDAALTDAEKNRKVRDRLLAQEAKARKAQEAAEKKAAAERKAKQPQLTREQRWAQVEDVRARFAPRETTARDGVNAERQARRAAYDADLAERAANPRPPEPKVKKTPVPSALRSQVEQERAARRDGFYAVRRPVASPVTQQPHGAHVLEEIDEPQFRRDRRS